MPKLIGQDASVYKRITCKKCGGINEYLPNEVRVLYKGRDYGGDTSITEGFNCAQCGSEVVTRSY